MTKLVLNVPTFGFLIATRAMIGVGVGLLISQKMGPERRRAIAWSLISIGAASTVPGLIAVFRQTRNGRLAA